MAINVRMRGCTIMIRIPIFCWAWTVRRRRECVRWQRALQRSPWRWKRHIGMGQSPEVCYGGLLSVFSTVRLRRPECMMMYHFVAVALTDVDDVTERRDHVDVNASALIDSYPSSDTEFWNDICWYSENIIPNKNYCSLKCFSMTFHPPSDYTIQ